MTDREPIEVQGDSIGRTTPPGWHTRTHAARAIGKSYDTLKRWHEDGTYMPSGWFRRGELKVWLYSDADIVALRQIAKTVKPGRPRREQS